MARRAGVGSVHAAGGQPTAEQAPVSTLAAKIVDSRSDVKVRQQPEGKDLFARLLQEYLNDPAIEEAHLGTNAKLVLVVAEAGLDAAFRDDPFSHNDRLDQVRDSIAVIRLTIERVPSLLLYTDPDDSNVASLPVFLTIFPKILAILSHPQLEALYDDAVELLTACIVAPSNDLGTWTTVRSIEEAVASTLDDLLCALEQEAQPQPSHASYAFSLDIPSQKTICVVRPEFQEAIVVPRGSQTPVASSIHAAHIAVSLVASLSATGLKTVDFRETRHNQAVWLLQCLERIASNLVATLPVSKSPTFAWNALSRACHVMSTVLSTLHQHSTMGRPDLTALGVLQELLHHRLLIGSSRFQNAVSHLLLAFIAMLQRLQLLADHSASMLYAAASELKQDEDRFLSLEKNLRSVLILALNVYESYLANTMGKISPQTPWPSLADVEDDALRAAFAALLPPTEVGAVDARSRPAKRRRTDGDSIQEPLSLRYSGLIEELALKLGMGSQTSLKGLEQELFARITNLSPADQDTALAAFAELPCQAWCLQNKQHHSSGKQLCGLCLDPQLGLRALDSPLEVQAYEGILSRLLDWPGLQRAKKGRVLIMLAVQRVVNHSTDSNALDVSKSPFGQWCLKSVHSSMRELRVAAGRCMASFMRHDVPASIRRANSAYCLHFLKALGERNDPSEKETLLLAWAQVARVCGNEELNIALLELVENLGASYSLISSVAYEEIERCADHRQTTVEVLFRPYWRTVAVAVVKDLRTKPQKLQGLCDLLGVGNINRFLLQTQAETIPYLVTNRQHEILLRIAAARNADVKDICLQPPKHLGLILASLLQHIPEPEVAIMELLSEVANEFKGMDLASLVRLEPITIACELFKAAGEAPSSKKASVHQAIKSFVALAERKSGQTKPLSRSTKLLAQFLDNHILGILTRLSDIVDGPTDAYAVPEKRRCLHAIAEMISMAQTHFNFAVAAPQVKACLQSAIRERDLCDDALVLWSIYVTSLEAEELDDLLEYTFAVIVTTWDRLTDETQARANTLIAQFIKEHNQMIRERILYLPSLSTIPLFAKYEAEIEKFKLLEPVTKRLEAFGVRCSSQNVLICEQATSELLRYLIANQGPIQGLSFAPEPHSAVTNIVHALIDCANRLSSTCPAIGQLSAQCLGVVGCIDIQESLPVSNHQQVVVLSNYDRVSETVDFIAYFLEHVLITAFHSAANSRVQNYLAWAMQELLKHCDFKSVLSRSRSSQSGPQSQRWLAMSETARNTLLPFFDTKYMLNRSGENGVDLNRHGPIFSRTKSHSEWLRELVFDLLQRARGENTKIFFPVLSRIIRGHDLSIPRFLFPYAATNIMLAGTDTEKTVMQHELLVILETDIDDLDPSEADHVKKASENVFEVLDYMARWLQRKRKQLSDARTAGARGTTNSHAFDEVAEVSHISSIEQVFEGIPADIIANRATQCRSFSRAIYHWEQHLREQREMDEHPEDEQEVLRELQQVYANIDEPDCIEGLSSHMLLLDAESEATVLEYRIHGRWSAALSWYELELERYPTDEKLQLDMLSCFKESGQLNALLQFVNSRRILKKQLVPDAYAYAAEAAWSLGDLDILQGLIEDAPVSALQDARVGIGSLLLTLRANDVATAAQQVSKLRDQVMSSLSASAAPSAKSRRRHLLDLHVLFEVERIAAITEDRHETKYAVIDMMESRLRLLGTVTADKQYLLGIRRAAMLISSWDFTKSQVSSTWIISARLSRKAELINVAFDAINHASQMSPYSALIEYARLLWKDGSHKKAIQTLKGAVDADAFRANDILTNNSGLGTVTEDQHRKAANALLAKAELLGAKWLDQSGQAGSAELIREYQTAVRSNPHWEKGHYYLGRFYNKILESEKILPTVKQGRAFATGETAKLVIDNFIRSIGFGSKYHYQSVPKILTLWLDFGQDVYNDIGAHKPKYNHDIDAKRKEYLSMMHTQILKYVDRLQPYLFYTAMPQMISRISHPHKHVWETLAHIIIRTSAYFPRESLWSLLPLARSTAKDKMDRGNHILSRLRQGFPKKDKGSTNVDIIKTLINQAQKLTESLLLACEHEVDQRVSHVELTRDLNFHHKRLTPCGLVVPIEKTLMATLPTMPGAAAIRTHKAFPYGDVLIEGFIEDVLVLSSLQRPRKLTVRGSDGQLYGLLCKPKDDLRKDQRLMEFNAMIERSLKRDVHASKRHLYIKTYGVVPLNEECGTIEWVDGLKPMRDIIISSYKSKGIRIDYNEIRGMLTEACANLPRSASVFTDKILRHFKPVLYEWFIDMFPEPEAWYAARLRYARSCAVMSIVGHVLGLGDRHGENVLLESGSGGVFHVDFNCLFDKGLTFEKPEKVPFRLTHNMVNAFGAYGVEGPFRKSAEVTLRVLRQHEDTLMTIMETFLYDPTADFMGSHRKKKSVPGVPENPTEVLESVRNKLRGFKHGEKVPLSIEGYVDDLINQARSPQNLTEMYIGWCAFF